MTRLYVVRHGAAAEAAGLTAAGVEQVRRLGERLRGEPVAGVRHSPRRRAVETAVLLGELVGAPVEVDGVLDDRTPVPAPGDEDAYPSWLHGWFAGVPGDERDEGGARLTAAAEAYLADDRPLILVTHAFVVAWFVRHVLGAPAAAWTAVAVDNASLTTIDRRPDRPPTLRAVNDTGHLPRPPG
jgi:probable phosphoglycerate mutase